jgi:hypothetical protein
LGLSLLLENQAALEFGRAEKSLEMSHISYQLE